MTVSEFEKKKPDDQAVEKEPKIIQITSLLHFGKDEKPEDTEEEQSRVTIPVVSVVVEDENSRKTQDVTPGFIWCFMTIIRWIIIVIASSQPLFIETAVGLSVIPWFFAILIGISNISHVYMPIVFAYIMFAITIAWIIIGIHGIIMYNKYIKKLDGKTKHTSLESMFLETYALEKKIRDAFLDISGKIDRKQDKIQKYLKQIQKTKDVLKKLEKNLKSQQYTPFGETT